MAHQTEHARRASLAAAACPAADLPPLGTDPGAPAAVGPPTNDDAQGWGAKGIGDQRQSEQANCNLTRSRSRRQTVRHIGGAGRTQRHRNPRTDRRLPAVPLGPLPRTAGPTRRCGASAADWGTRMKPRSTPPPHRPHPLLYAACTCATGPCLACTRWRRHYQAVAARVRVWKDKA